MTKKTESPATADQYARPVTLDVRMLPVKDLVVNGEDARIQHDEKQDARLERSIREVGVLVPLIVTSAGGLEIKPPFTIQEGHRRYRAATKLGIEEVPCSIVHGDVPFGLVANEVRLNLSIVDMASAVDNLIAKGMLPEAIKLDLGISSERYWKQVLKIGQLADSIKGKLRAGKIDEETAWALTAYPKDQQEKVLKAAGGNNANYRNIRHLTQQKSIDAAACLPTVLDKYREQGGSILEDLFAEDKDSVRLTDTPLFWTLQREKILADMEASRDLGQLVYLLDDSKSASTAHMSVQKHDDKRVKPATIWHLHASGHCQVTKNGMVMTWGNRGTELLDVETGEWISSKEAEKEKRRVAKERQEKAELPPEEKAPFTKSGADWLKRDVTIAVARELAKAPHAAMAIAVMALLGNAENTTMYGGESVAFTTMRNVCGDKAYPSYKEKYGPILRVIEETMKAGDKVTLPKLLEMSSAQLGRLFAALVANTLEFDRHGGQLYEDTYHLIEYFDLNIGKELVISNLFESYITKAGCIAWAKQLKVKIDTDAPRKKMLEAIAKACGSLEKAAQTALPPLTGTVQQ